MKLALPSAIQIGKTTDSFGIRESIEQTLYRDLGLSGFFELIPNDRLLHDAKTEAMTPRFADYFNAGAQAVIKASYEIRGQGKQRSVVLDLRLFSVATEQRISLTEPFNQPKALSLTPVDLRRYTTQFADEVIRHFTGQKGVFSSRLAVVKRTKRGKEIYMFSPMGSKRFG